MDGKVLFLKKGIMKIMLKRLAIALMMIITVTILFSGCSSSRGKTSGSPDEVLTIVWKGGETEIRISELMDLDYVEREISAIDSENEDCVRLVKGVLLEDVLNDYIGIGLSGICSIRFSAGDGYVIEIPPETVEKSEIILAYEIDGEPLQEESKPFRAIIPDERTLYWVKNLVEVELIEGDVQNKITGVVFIESLIKVLETEDYDYNGSIDKAVPAADLLMEFREEDEQDFIKMISADGLEKNENKEIFEGGFLKIDGEDSPVFLDPEIPRGMWLKDIFAIFYGQTAYISAAQSIEMFENTQVEGKKGVFLKEIMEKAEMEEYINYLMRALDGYSVEVSSLDLENGVLYINEDGQVCTYFEELGKKYAIKDLLSIENKK
jgi:DMSO/TMAO reductase YedYZ molybdopterin-dependent catalytic subunit